MDEKTLSTHVLDMTLGKPGAGIPVSLFRKEGAKWIELASEETDQDGRIQNFIPKNDFVVGQYRMIFNVEAFFKEQELKSILYEIPLQFQVNDCSEHFHIPLLLSPNGYNTYRGS